MRKDKTNYEKAIRHALIDQNLTLSELAKKIHWANSWIYDVLTTPEDRFAKHKVELAAHLGIKWNGAG